MKNLFLLAANLVWLHFTNAQFTQEWFSHYQKEGLQFPSACKILTTIDATYVLAQVQGNPQNDEDLALLKFGPQGNLIWEKIYTVPGNLHDEPVDLAMDESGYLYVTASSAPEGLSTAVDYCTIKYSPGGDQLWVQRWGKREYAEHPCGMAVRNGIVFISGTGVHSVDASTSTDYFSMLYQANTGKQIWSHSWNGSGGDWINSARDIALDNGSNLIVVGTSEYPNYDYGIIRYQWDTIQPKNPGDSIKYVLRFDWERWFNGQGDQTDEALFVTTDAAQNIYVTGSAYSTTGKQDVVTLKFDKAGNQLWQASMNGTSNSRDEPIGIQTDQDQNVLVAGWLMNVNTKDDFFAVKYSPDGKMIWATPINLNDQTARPEAMLVSGNNLILGGTAGISNEPFVEVLNQNGQVIWDQYLKAPGGKLMIGKLQAITVDQKGDLYFTGQNLAAEGGPKLFVTKYRRN